MGRLQPPIAGSVKPVRDELFILSEGVSAMFRITSPSSQDHEEAVCLARMCRHVPVGAIVIVGFALLNVASAIASILAVGSVNGMLQ
jgi:hypothetical protein